MNFQYEGSIVYTHRAIHFYCACCKRREGRHRFGNGLKRLDHDARDMTLIYFSVHDQALDHESIASQRSLLCRRRRRRRDRRRLRALCSA